VRSSPRRAQIIRFWRIATSQSGGGPKETAGAAEDQRRKGTKSGAEVAVPNHQVLVYRYLAETFPPLASFAPAALLAKGRTVKSRRYLNSSLPQHRINPSTHIVRRTAAARLNLGGWPPRENEGVA
jgi:hypothetical protein